MKLGIMQPYFFPYIGYFSLIDYCDKFVFFDTPQYISHGWVNRNRILKQDGSPQYIIAPIQKASRETAIQDIKIDNTQKWKESIMGGLSGYKKKAPYYKAVINLINEIFSTEFEYLSEFNIDSIMRICEYIGITTPFEIYSKMDINVEESVTQPDEWALYITEEMGYDTYVNPPGGKTFFEREKYKNHNIELEFLEVDDVSYIQRIGRFEANLSIIDVMMFNSPDEIRNLLKKIKIT